MSPIRPVQFVLDHNVDAAALGVLRSNGWSAHSLNELGIYDATDEAVAIVASERDAVAVTVDVEFSRWRRQRLIGRHMQLRCSDPDVVDVLDSRIHDVVPALAHNDNVFVILSKDRSEIEYPKWVP